MKHVSGSDERVGWPIVRLLRDDRGITGLETAIILIAFVVVASVFAFTVLSTGIFSAERGKETVFAGLAEARGTIAPRGSVLANGLPKDVVSLDNAAWTGTTTTVTADTTDKKEGTGSADIVVQTAFLTGLAAYEDLTSTVDLTDQTQVQLWIKSTTTTVAGTIEIVMDETAGCGSPEVQTNIPALTADTWKLVTAGLTDSADVAVTNANKDAITCVGIRVATDLSTASNVTINVDEIIVVGLITSLVVNITNAVEGEPVNLTAPSDSDNNGVADSDGQHVMTVTYTDKNQLIRDLYWTKAYLGENDGDDLLETRERMEVTVYLNGLADATPLVKDLDFQLEFKPSKGSVLVIERRTPAVIDTVMNFK